MTLPIITLLICIACTKEERPEYEIIENTLPEGGPKVEINIENNLMNLNEIRKFLGETNYEKFNSSISWYGTEASFPIDRILGQTPKHAVETVNCLKTTTPEKQEACFSH